MPAAHVAGTVPYLLWFPHSSAAPDGFTVASPPEMETEQQNPKREPLAAPSHIIERPRLIKLMEESGARVIVLNAPAGYGKTTLARQWARSGGRRSTWYRCTSSSSDVAVLARSLAAELKEVAPAGIGERIAHRIASVSSAEADTGVIAELFIDASAPWPDDLWLILDDYHAIAGSPAAETLLQTLIEGLSARTVITTRSRPAWILPRQIVYGEVLELDRTLLAMTDEEARTALALASTDASLVVRHSRGWPAVIGLAAALPPSRHPAVVPPTLLEFLADELFKGLDARVKTALLELSLSPAGSREDASALIGSGGDDLLAAAETAGFFAPSSLATDELHPLLRAFLRSRLERTPDALTKAARDLVALYLSQDRLDDAFAVGLEAKSSELALSVFEIAFERLLAEGRLATLARWIGNLDDRGIESPLLDLAAAELAFREGLHEKAERLASEAARRLDPANPRKVQALIRAGQAAAQADKMEAARRQFKQARAIARAPHDQREALLGELFAALELESSDLDERVREVADMAADDIDSAVRRESAMLVVALRTGGVLAAVERAKRFSQLNPRVKDLFTRAAFTNALAHAYNATARYNAALQLTRAQTNLSRTHGMDFAVPHTLHAEVVGLLGLGKLERARVVIGELSNRARATDDVHFGLNAVVLRARHLLLARDPTSAVNLLAPQPEPRASAGLRAEYLATRALALLASGDRAGALSAAAAAKQETRWLAESAVLAKCVEVWSEYRAGTAANPEPLLELLELTGQVDQFVLSFRALEVPVESILAAANPASVERMFYQADVPEITTYLGLEPTTPAFRSELSKREHEVYELLCRGMSNRDIADTLFLSEKTVKVHLRHIYEKLGVKTRTQAAVLGRRLGV